MMEILQGNRTFCVLCAIGLLVACLGVICTVILWFQGRRLKRLASAMKSVASGRLEVKKPVICSKKIRMLWNGLAELARQMKTGNYNQSCMLQAYYRFVPKNMGQIFQKNSMIDVKSGDRRNISGTMAVISNGMQYTGGIKELGHINRLLDEIGRYQLEEQGLMMSFDNNLSMVKLLFLEENCRTVALGMNFLHMLGMNTASMLLYHSDFVYGIVGTERQSAALLASQDNEALEEYAEHMREWGLHLVITESVKEREQIEEGLRYIGYVVHGGSEKKTRLYEVLEACESRERSAKLACRKRFAKALSLFYENDFYLARSAFSDILKEVPEDTLSKWYLFACEKYLNESNQDEVAYNLNQVL